MPWLDAAVALTRIDTDRYEQTDRERSERLQAITASLPPSPAEDPPLHPKRARDTAAIRWRFFALVMDGVSVTAAAKQIGWTLAMVSARRRNEPAFAAELEQALEQRVVSIHGLDFVRQSTNLYGRVRWFVRCRCGWSPGISCGSKTLAMRAFNLHIAKSSRALRGASPSAALASLNQEEE